MFKLVKDIVKLVEIDYEDSNCLQRIQARLARPAKLGVSIDKPHHALKIQSEEVVFVINYPQFMGFDVISYWKISLH